MAIPQDTTKQNPSQNQSDTLELLKKIVEQHDIVLKEHDLFKQILDRLTIIESSAYVTPRKNLIYYNTDYTTISVATPNLTAGAAYDPNQLSVSLITGGLTGYVGYQSEQIYAQLHRISPKIHVINDGTATIYVIASSDGINWSREAPIPAGEARAFFNVFELRLRSPTAGILSNMTGGVYRVTELDIWLPYSKLVFSSNAIPKTDLQNQALPAINTNWLATDISPTNTPCIMRVQVAVSIAGNLSAVITNSGNSQVVLLNSTAGPALVAGGLYIFDIKLHSGDSLNLIYSATGGTIQILRTEEIDTTVA